MSLPYTPLNQNLSKYSILRHHFDPIRDKSRSDLAGSLYRSIIQILYRYELRLSLNCIYDTSLISNNNKSGRTVASLSSSRIWGMGRLKRWEWSGFQDWVIEVWSDWRLKGGEEGGWQEHRGGAFATKGRLIDESEICGYKISIRTAGPSIMAIAIYKRHFVQSSLDRPTETAFYWVMGRAVNPSMLAVRHGLSDGGNHWQPVISWCLQIYGAGHVSTIPTHFA